MDSSNNIIILPVYCTICDEKISTNLDIIPICTDCRYKEAKYQI